jgi:hypothetical protein
MRKLNISLILFIAVISACLGTFLFLAETRGFAYQAASTGSLFALSTISIAYATRLIRTDIKSAKTQIVILTTYIFSATSAATAAGVAGSIPHIMQSMEIDLTAAFKHIWPSLVAGVAITTVSYAFAHILITRKNTYQPSEP